MRVRKYGFPCRMKYEEFYNKYHELEKKKYRYVRADKLKELKTPVDEVT